MQVTASPIMDVNTLRLNTASQEFTNIFSPATIGASATQFGDLTIADDALNQFNGGLGSFNGTGTQKFHLGFIYYRFYMTTAVAAGWVNFWIGTASSFLGGSGAFTTTTPTGFSPIGVLQVATPIVGKYEGFGAFRATSGAMTGSCNLALRVQTSAGVAYAHDAMSVFGRFG